MTVKPISDEELDVAERLSVSREVSATATWILNGTVSAIIARLRAAEPDAKRWRHARNILTVEAIESAQSDYINFGLPPAESESIRADQAIDAAMERTP
ncbi:TPA: hypothetical protein ACRXTU_000261 [Pseudomonas aeruginosa]